MNITKHIIALITSLTLFALSTSAIAMTDMNGSPAQVQNMIGKGKWTVAKIWASDCSACHKSIHEINQFQRSFPEVDVFGITVDGQSGKPNADKFIRYFKVKFPNLLSSVNEVDNYLYSKVGDTLIGTPTIIIFTPQGKIAAVQPGAVTSSDLISFIRSQ